MSEYPHTCSGSSSEHCEFTTINLGSRNKFNINIHYCMVDENIIAKIECKKLNKHAINNKNSKNSTYIVVIIF